MHPVRVAGVLAFCITDDAGVAFFITDDAAVQSAAHTLHVVRVVCRTVTWRGGRR